jgi:hypothetical protein
MGFSLTSKTLLQYNNKCNIVCVNAYTHIHNNITTNNGRGQIMPNNNIVSDTKKRIAEMIETKQNELKLARQKEHDAREEIAAATEEIKTATADMNLQAYEAATALRDKARTAADMYAAKAEQIRQQEYVTEEESDRVIDRLLEHEQELYKTFLDATSGPLEQLKKCCATYWDGIRETEALIQSWTRDIHANYRSEGTMYANGTNRADTPQPVRKVAFTGHRFYITAKEFIDRADKDIIDRGTN